MCRRAVEGNSAIKAAGKTYLPATFVSDDPERYAQYLERAYFLGVTGRTKEAFSGMVFRKPPVAELTPRLALYDDDIDGAGSSLEQLSKEAVGELLQVGRVGLLADYPTAETGMDAESEMLRGLRPVMRVYPAESIINWKMASSGGRNALVIVVMVESADSSADEFGHESETRYRVLRMRDGVYTQTLYDHKQQQIGEERIPRMAGGAPFDHIPFYIVGAVNNYPEPDMPPLYDLAVLNISHYQNTADLEESSYMAGQPTYHLNIGETDPDVWKSMNPSGMIVGSRRGVITKGGSLDQVQAQPNNLPFELMRHKEQQMVSIGARLVQRGAQPETAEAARINASAESSTLESIVGNASEGIEAALEDMALFLGENPLAVLFSLNRDFWESGLSAQDLQAVQAGVGVMYSAIDAIGMIRRGRISLDPERTNDDILSDAASAMLDEPRM
jgi:hypothetical protein